MSQNDNYPNGVNVTGAVSSAANIRSGSNPVYTLDAFKEVYPQFKTNAAGVQLVPDVLLSAYIGLADASIKEARWHELWSMAMGFFVAHFASLWLQGMADPNSGAGAVIAAGKAKGLMSSKSVDGVSVGYDYSSIAQDLDGWAAWKLTVYGQQLATFGKMVGRGGMYIY